MDDPYRPPETPLGVGLEPVGSSRPSSSPSFGKGPALFLTTVMTLVGATVAQVAALVPMLLGADPRVTASLRGQLRVWFAASGIVACCGLIGVYLCLRRASTRSLPLVAFLVFSSVTARVNHVSFSWPFQLHAGMMFGQLGIGLNLVGVGLLLWWRMLGRREESRAEPAPMA